MTVDEAISYLRRQAPQVETIYYAYALDDAQHLLGVVSFRDLFSADRDKTVREAMRTQFVTAAWLCRSTWSDAPLGRARHRQSRDTVDEIVLGISGDPSGFAKIRSKLLR